MSEVASAKEEKINISDFMHYDAAARTIICNPMKFKKAVTIEINMKASLSDRITTVSKSFLIKYQPTEAKGNKPPYFVDQPKR